ncbi:hypothetical protein NDU88_008892 [Pleurodeles waltl]|uniref:Uncharacterized protein n=1 Tax=Pleurodeles waltl TaxID=8319 RepID=A0AAV7PSX1_PLEWA|nr:hypothetical protein NDU88_008892 [Pleurodeles waltl]
MPQLRRHIDSTREDYREVARDEVKTSYLVREKRIYKAGGWEATSVVGEMEAGGMHIREIMLENGDRVRGSRENVEVFVDYATDFYKSKLTVPTAEV